MMKMIPLQDVILYSNETYPNKFWTRAHNATDWSIMMTEMTTAGNALAKLMLQNLAHTLHGAHIGSRRFFLILVEIFLC